MEKGLETIDWSWPLRALAAPLRTNRCPTRAWDYNGQNYKIASTSLYYIRPRLLAVASKKSLREQAEIPAR